MNSPDRRVYVNHGASSHPKPESVTRAVADALAAEPTDPHRGPAGARDPLSACREELARLIHVCDPRRVLLAPHATFALNQAIHGSIEHHLQRRRGTEKVRVVTTVLEHNSILRPLTHAQDSGKIDLTILGEEEVAAPDRIEGHLRKGAKLLAVTACSNVTGARPDLRAIGAACAGHGTDLIVDAAQAAGCIELDGSVLPPRTLIAVSGHKGLLGPQGTGALYLGEGFATEELDPILRGGTGARSEILTQPTALPIRFESGTQNAPGFAGLAAGVREVRAAGVAALGARRSRLAALLKDSIRALPGVRLVESRLDDPAAGLVAMTFSAWEPEEMVQILSDAYGIVARGGLHCAPLFHRARGLAQGTVRVSIGWGNTEDDIHRVAGAIADLAQTRAAA